LGEGGRLAQTPGLTDLGYLDTLELRSHQERWRDWPDEARQPLQAPPAQGAKSCKT